MLFHGNKTNTLRLEVVNSFAEPQRRGALICHLALWSEGDTAPCHQQHKFFSWCFLPLSDNGQAHTPFLIWIWWHLATAGSPVRDVMGHKQTKYQPWKPLHVRMFWGEQVMELGRADWCWMQHGGRSRRGGLKGQGSSTTPQLWDVGFQSLSFYIC